jgi:hypothetical protein
VKDKVLISFYENEITDMVIYTFLNDTVPRRHFAFKMKEMLLEYIQTTAPEKYEEIVNELKDSPIAKEDEKKTKKINSIADGIENMWNEK